MTSRKICYSQCVNIKLISNTTTTKILFSCSFILKTNLLQFTWCQLWLCLFPTKPSNTAVFAFLSKHTMCFSVQPTVPAGQESTFCAFFPSLTYPGQAKSWDITIIKKKFSIQLYVYIYSFKYKIKAIWGPRQLCFQITMAAIIQFLVTLRQEIGFSSSHLRTQRDKTDDRVMTVWIRK